MRLMQTNMLDTNQIFTSRDVLLNSPLKTILLPAAPGRVCSRAAGVAEPCLVHLGPIAGAVVLGDGSWSLGDVHKSRSGVLDELVVEELEAELVTSLDCVRWGRARLGAFVASKIIRVH